MKEYFNEEKKGREGLRFTYWIMKSGALLHQKKKKPVFHDMPSEGVNLFLHEHSCCEDLV